MGLTYNSANSDFYDISNEKTDHRTDHRTDYQTDRRTDYPTNVTHCRGWGPWRTCGWPTHSVNNANRARNQANREANERGREMNEGNTQLNADNTALNSKNTAKNQAYQSVVNTSKVTSTGEYASRRDSTLEESAGYLRGAGASEDEIREFVGELEGQYKAFYRDKKLQVWNSDLGTKPDYGDFDPSYYGATYKDVKDAYKRYQDDDDIDVTEGYGKENYYYWHYTNQGKDAGNRGNRAEILAQARDYLEESPEFAEGGWENQTDTELAFIRDQQLGIGDNQTERFLNVPEIASLWEEAKQASQEGRDNHFINLGKEYFLDVNKADEFAALFRLSKRPEDKQISFDYSLENGAATGITELEDAITGSVGAQGLTDTKKFAALNQNILKDSMNELRKAKIKEQELDMLSGFGTFSEIFDINTTLTDSLLNDTGIGGYLPFAGGSGGFDKESLEEQLKGVTGVRNEVVYNWQEWFDNSIKEKYQNDLDLGFSIEEAEDNVQIQKEFAESYINDYLKPRFDESRSMNEFVDYLDVRQEEQNPFQTQSLLNALNEIGNRRARTFLDQIRQDAIDAGGKRGFTSSFYFDPTVSEGSEENEKYIKQRDTISSDWDQARDNPDSQIEGLSYNTTWKAQAYRYGVDINNQDQFARLHYQVKGKLPDYRFDGAEDIVNVDKVKNLLYDNILPALESEVQNTKTIFGNFIRPEEFADDMLEGLDPNEPESWSEALKELGLDDFKGSLDDLKEYITSTLRTGSAEDIRAQIKFLNEKRKKPDQYLLGVEYIAREEDYKPADRLKGDTQLYKIFQDAGYEGTEDDFYENVFPDLDPSSQAILSQAGSKDGKITLEGFGSDYRSDPFAAFAGISQLTGGDSDLFGGTTKEDTDKEDDASVADSFRLFADDDDDDDDSIFGKYKKTKSGQEILSEYTKSFGSFF